MFKYSSEKQFSKQSWYNTIFQELFLKIRGYCQEYCRWYICINFKSKVKSQMYILFYWAKWIFCFVNDTCPLHYIFYIKKSAPLQLKVTHTVRRPVSSPCPSTARFRNQEGYSTVKAKKTQERIQAPLFPWRYI